MVAEPAPVAVTGTDTLFAPAAKVAVEGTVAALVLLELRLTVRPPAGALPERTSVRGCVERVVNVRLFVENAIVAVTCTAVAPPVYPGAATLIVAGPGARPVNCGCATGLVCPEPMTMVEELTETFEGSLLVRVSVIPVGGAGEPSVMASPAVWPSGIERLDGTVMAPRSTTLTVAAVSGSAGRELA